MLRGPPGLVAHENSGVAGLSAAAVVDERRAVASSTTELPSPVPHEVQRIGLHVDDPQE